MRLRPHSLAPVSRLSPTCCSAADLLPEGDFLAVSGLFFLLILTFDIR